MRQFSVCRIRGSSRRRSERLVVVLQHDQLADLRTRIAAPLLNLTEAGPVDYLTLDVSFDGRRYRISFHKMATLDARDLEEVGHLDVQVPLMRAVDLIFAGV